MSIQNVSGNNSTLQTYDISAIGNSTQSTGSIAPSAMGGSEMATISGPGQFFSDLQQLSQSDPTKFKQVASQLATSFQNAASNATGADAQRLNSIANNLSQAAQTGSLQPPQPPPSAGTVGQTGDASGSGGAHHHHHHHGGGGGGGGQSSAMNQAFQAATSILTQSLSSSSSTTTATTLTSSTQTTT